MIEHYLNQIEHYLQLYPYMGGLFALIVSFAESLPLIGTIVPGSITMSVIGILIGRGMIDFEATLFWATIGALAGDTIGFWIGKVYKERLHHMWPFKKHPKWLTLSEDFFQKHGGKSILIGRFVGPARSSVPLIAGLLKMTWSRFFIAAIPSAILWAIAYMLPGVLIGAISLEIPHGMATKFMLIGLLVIILLWLVFWAIQRFFVFIVSFINRLIDKLWNWLNRHHSSKFFIRAITNKINPKDHHQLMLVMLAFVCLVLFLVTLINVAVFGPITSFNEPLFHFLQSIRTHHANEFFVGMTMLGEVSVIYPIGALIFLGLVFKKQWRVCWHLALVMILAGASVYFFKGIIHSPRPTGFVFASQSSSFPSGHTALSLMILGFISFLTAQQIPRKWHWIPYTIVSTLVGLVAFSRLYLGAHWLTDILGSLFLGFTILLAVITSYRRRLPKPFGSLAWLIFVVLTVVSLWTVLGSEKFSAAMKRYEPYWPVRQVAINEWWKHPIHYVPVYRHNRFGQPIQPFNLQWADSLNNIKYNLLQNGWKIIANKTGVKTTLGRFASQRPEAHMPFLAQLHRHQPPVVFLIKQVPNQPTIIELRLWDSGIQFYGNPMPLWVGSLNYHIPPERLISLKRLNQITLNGDGGAQVLAKDLDGYQLKFIRISMSDQPKKVLPLNWNGKILIIRSSYTTSSSQGEPNAR